MIKIGNSNYTPDFLNENMMGPNSLRIIDELVKNIAIHRNMKVLDLGCGRGSTSIYLAKEFNSTIFATDLWIDATSNYERFKEAQVDNNIIPLHADANDLPFPDSYFDLIICIDAYHYFGYDRSYLPEKMLPLLKPNGIIAVAVPGFKNEFNSIPDEMTRFIKEDYHFHTCNWWQDLWSQAKDINIITCKELNCIDEAWKDWLACDNPHAVEDREMMKAEGGKYFSLVAIIGQKT